MPRTSQWAANDEMWEHAAQLIHGGMTYSQVSGRLSTPELSKRFGLEVAPKPDTIRWQLKRRGLLDRRIPRSALPPDELDSHHRELVFLGLAIREQANTGDGGRRGPTAGWVRRLNAGKWHGFRAGPLQYPVPKEDEEFDVHDDWTDQLFDPRQLALFDFFVEHLKATAFGRTAAESLDALFGSAATHSAAFQALWISAEKLIDEQPVTGPNESSRERIDDLMRELHPSGRISRVPVRSSTRHVKQGAKANEEVVDIFRSSPEHVQLVRSWKIAIGAVEKVKLSLKPTTLVRRMIQDGQCAICKLGSHD